MITLSVGMPRAGSGWYYNLTHDLVVAGGGRDARQVRRRYRLGGVLTEVNCNIGALTPWRLALVLVPALRGETFTIKAHAAPTSMARFLMRRGWMRAAYIYRDPRDAMLSAYDYGRKAVEKGRPNAFSHLVNYDAAADFMLEYLHVWQAWIDEPGVLHTRYEALRDDYETEVARLVRFLELDPDASEIGAVIERYRPKGAARDERGMHFNKGKTGRFRQVLSEEQQKELAMRFGGYLEKMDYEV